MSENPAMICCTMISFDDRVILWSCDTHRIGAEADNDERTVDDVDLLGGSL